MTEFVPGPDAAEDPAATGSRPAAARHGESLSDRDAAMLAFEASQPRGPERAREIRDRFDMSTTRYHQVLNRLIDTPAALQRDPQLVQRLRRVRETRQRARSASRLPDWHR